MKTFKNTNYTTTISEPFNQRLGRDGKTLYQDYNITITYQSNDSYTAGLDGKVEQFTHIATSKKEAEKNAETMAEGLICDVWKRDHMDRMPSEEYGALYLDAQGNDLNY
jgi:hypothetical protein